MDVRMPDGVILRGVPDGTPKDQIMAKYNKSKLDKKIVSDREAWRKELDPTIGMSDDDLFMAGAGKAVTDLGRGVKQIGAWAMDKIAPQKSISDLVTGQDSSRLGKLRAEQDEVNKRDAALMATGNGVGGNITGSVATTLLPAGALSRAPGVAGRVGQMFVNPTTMRSAAATGAAIGALQPVGTGESRAENAGLGALFSAGVQGVAQGLGKIAQPVKKALSPVDDHAVNVLERAGVQLDAAQKTGSNRLAQVKRFLADNPVTAGGQVKQAEKTAASFTQAALKEIGESADVADETVLGRASTRIGKEFDRIAASNPIKADNQLLNDLVSINQEASRTLESGAAGVISRQVDEVLAKANNGQIEGKAYQAIKSELDRIASGPNAQLGHLARGLRGKLDDALQRSAQPGDHAALKLARRQYGNLENIIKAVNPDGNVSPSKLFNASNTLAYGQKKAMATGRGQTKLQQLAKAGTRVIPERMPNSGTTPRALLQAALPAAAGGAYGFAQDGNIGDAAKFAALGVGAPLLAQQAINNPAMANYLAHGIGQPAVRGLLRAPANEALMLRQIPTMGLLGLQAEE
jgi:hypothetical protein